MTKSWFPILLELVVDVPQMFFPEQDLPLNTASRLEAIGSCLVESRSVNVSRSMLSSTPNIGIDNRKEIGKHPLVIRLMKGIFQAKPPTSSIHPSIVLSHLYITARNTLSLFQLAKNWSHCWPYLDVQRLRLSRQTRLSLLVPTFILIWEPKNNPSVSAHLFVCHCASGAKTKLFAHLSVCNHT
jgi:hypothetical protein